MLGLGWSEMLVLSVVVLIVVGPKDLPMMLRNIGRMMGGVRRMSNEFRREIDKAIALDEVKEAKKAISDPLRQTSEEITREFNTFKNGKYQPSGKLKPSEPGKESVTSEIRKQAGLPEPEGEKTPSKASEAIKARVQQNMGQSKAAAAGDTPNAPKPATASKSASKAVSKKAPAKPAAAKGAAKPATSKTAASKPAAKSTAKPATAKPAAKAKPAATKSTGKKAAAQKPTAKKPAAKAETGAGGETS